MRKTYEIDGMSFAMRTFTGRDIAKINGRLSLLPMGEAARGKPIDGGKLTELSERLLVLCSKGPTRIVDDTDGDVPDGCIPVSEIPDAIFNELVRQLSEDSGFTSEAAEEVRPTSGTSAAS